MKFEFTLLEIQYQNLTVIYQEASPEEIFLDVIIKVLNQIQNIIGLDGIAVLNCFFHFLDYNEVRKSCQEIHQQNGLLFALTLRDTMSSPRLDLPPPAAMGIGAATLGLSKEMVKELEKLKHMNRLDDFPNKNIKNESGDASSIPSQPKSASESVSSKLLPPSTSEERKLSLPPKLPSPMAGPPAGPLPTSPLFATLSAGKPMAAPGSPPPPGIPSPIKDTKTLRESMMQELERFKQMRKSDETEIEKRKKESDYASDIPSEIDKKKAPQIKKETIITSKSEPQSYQKNLAMEYYDRMNPESYYPLILNIADIEQAFIAPEENILTGERKIQKKEKMEVVLKTPIVKVRPIFPGCSVTPTEITTNFKEKEDELTFYVTPLVKGDVEGYVEFVNEGDVVHTLNAPTKVDDPRYAKTIAAYGTLASMLPRLLIFLGYDLGPEVNMASLLPVFGGYIGGMGLTNFIAMIGVSIMLIISFFIYRSRKPKSTKINFHFSDFKPKRKIS